MPGGTIVFVPDASKGERGRIAFGKIRPDGGYTLKTEAGKGASAGWYKVSVVSLSAALAQTSQSFQFPQSNLPEKYRDPDLSMLVCEVEPAPDQHHRLQSGLISRETLIMSRWYSASHSKHEATGG